MTDARVIAYLRKGAPLAASPGPVRDVLNPSRGFAGTASVLTDGTWVWRDDLPYYVEHYAIALRDEFLRHVEQLGYVVPSLTDEARSQLRY